MGLSLSLLLSSCKETLKTMIYNSSDNANTVTLRSFSFNKRNGKMIVRTYSFKKNDSESISKTDESDKMTLERSLSFKKWEPEHSKLKSNLSFKNLVLGSHDASLNSPKSKEPERSKLKSNISFKNLVLDSHDASLNSPKSKQPERPKLKSNLSFKNLVLDSHDASSNAPKSKENDVIRRPKPTIILPEPVFLFSPRPVSELDAAAIKLQKVYKSYRTRRNLADCAVVVEELWWKALDFASLKRSSVSFFNIDKHETAVSRWSRARTRAAKVGKGLSKDEKAQKLALQHWLEAIDPRHRYGHNLHFYYDIWFDSESTQPFFYWLDIGDGKEINLERCSRTNLQRQCIKYLGPKERECYEVVVESGKLVFRQSGILVNTIGDSKWIFVLSTSRSLYVGKKQKGVFQHSSFLAGGATTAAGRLVAQEGVLEAIWPYSGHYHPTEENFKEFVSFLEENNVDLTNVKKCAIDEDNYELRNTSSGSSNTDIVEVITTAPSETSVAAVVTAASEHHKQMESDAAVTAKCPAFEYGKRLSCKWSTGAGPRIGCVRDYPSELQNQALEHVNLSPRLTPGSYRNNGPIPSPRPSPKYRVSPRLAYMGVPSPRVSIRASG